MAGKKTGAVPQLLTVLVCRVAGHRFAVAAADVLEILPALTLLPLPESPSPIEGLARIRGAAVPVLDIRQRFGMPVRPMSPKDHLVLCRLGERRAALHVDRVLGLFDCQLDPVDRLGMPMAASAIGIASDSNGALLVHDLPALFAIDETEPALAAMGAL